MPNTPIAQIARTTFLDRLRTELGSGADRYWFTTSVEEGVPPEGWEAQLGNSGRRVWVGRFDPDGTERPSVGLVRREVKVHLMVGGCVAGLDFRGDLDKLEHDLFEALRVIPQENWPANVTHPRVTNTQLADGDLVPPGQASHGYVVLDVEMSCVEDRTP